jgi:phage tail-like protein
MDTLPPVSFYFQLSAEGSLASFQEVSGISSPLGVEEENMGENQFSHKLPATAKSQNLVLKRGLLLKSSQLASWLKNMMESDLSNPVNPQTIQVSLLDAEGGTLASWTFHQAYPVRWRFQILRVIQTR